MAFTTLELVELLNSDDKEERRMGARRIWTDWARLADKEILNNQEDYLIELMTKETDERDIWHLMIVLGLMNSTKALPIIINYFSNSEFENVRGFAADAIGRYQSKYLDEKIFELLWNYAENDSSLVVRVNSIRAITERYKNTKNKQISKRLLVLLNSQTHSAIQTTIFQQLGKIGCLEITPDLIHILITRRTETTKKIAGIALDEIAKINGYKDRKDLINLFKSKNPN